MKVAVDRTCVFRGVNTCLEISFHELSISFFFAGDCVYVDGSINDLSRNLIWINAHQMGSIAGARICQQETLGMPTNKGVAVPDLPQSRTRVAGMLAREHVTVLLSNIGARLSRGATAYYRAAWDISMVEWRLLMTLNSIEALNVSELSDAADVDKAAASRSLVLLQERKLISIVQTRSRGRAAIAKLTADGRKFAAKLVRVSTEREARLLKEFTRGDREHLSALLHQLSQALDHADWEH
jgi:DNA-binding MarR family transcriptional regulator